VSDLASECLAAWHGHAARRLQPHPTPGRGVLVLITAGFPCFLGMGVISQEWVTTRRLNSLR
jgi:hypothetical protein